MKAVVLSIRVKFTSVHHLSCADVQEMMAERGQREPQLLVIVLFSKVTSLLQ